MKKRWFIWVSIVVIVTLSIIALSIVFAITPKAEGKVQHHQTYRNVYAYCMDAGFDLDAIHNRVIETGLKDIAIGVQLYSIVHNQGTPAITVDELQAEIDWARKATRAVSGKPGTVGLIIYNETTRVGYDADGIYRYYRNWEQRHKIMSQIAESGIDYLLIDLTEVHYSSTRDLTTYLLAMQSIFGKVDYGVYDGDGCRDILHYEFLEDIDILIWSNVYIGDNDAYLRSPCGWDYDHLVLCSYLSPSPLCQPDSREDMELIYQLMREQDFKGLNIICTYMYQGVMPDWALSRLRSQPVPERVLRSE